MQVFRGVSQAVLAVVLIAGWSACSSADQQDPGRASAKDTDFSTARHEAALEQARSAADAMGAALMSRLAAEMDRGGPAAALQVCSEVAQEIAAQHSTDTLSVRRVSLKVRNPADRPDAFERAQLVQLEVLSQKDELPPEVTEVVQEGDRVELRYLRPIVVGQLCLQCHGERQDLHPQVSELLVKHYPEDEAVGYHVGDLRGAISVRVRLE